ncbi:MAG: flagellar hook-length control protein FliK, partial [Helicobacter sp.]|nr:flagellar hook-length control protein FliK [Helicobacter sp.]
AQLVQDIKDNLRDTILGFIGKENKEMPQTILGMSKGISNTEFAADIKDIVQKLETMLRETLRLEESETKAIGKEILIQNLLKDSNTTKIAFDKKDLVLMRAQSLVQAPQNQNAQSKEAIQNEILGKILSGSTMSLSLLKELGGSFVNYQEQEQWLQKFAEFANLNLKDFQYSGFNSTPIFSELGAKNPLLSALLQGNMELQKTLFDYAKEAQGGKAPNLAAPIPSRFVPNTAPAPKESDIKHPLTAKLAEMNAKTAAMVGAKPDYTPKEGKMTLEELLARERLAIQNAVEQTKTQTIMQQPNAAESSIAKTLQAFKEEIYKEVFNKKNDEQNEEETILNRQATKTIKTTDKKVSAKTSNLSQNNTQSSSASEDRYRQNNVNNERPNPTHSNQNTTSETLRWEQNEYDKKQASQQEAQKLHNQNTTLLTPEAKKQAASAGAGKTILDVLGAKITQSTQPKEAMPQAVVIDSKADILYRSAAAKETLRNFTGSLREGISNYKPPLSKLSIELSPEHLGNVEVTLKQRGAQLIVQIHSNPQALQLFMANAQDFKQQLFGIGYENVEMTFQDADGNTFSEGGGNGGNGGGQNGANGEQQHHDEHEHEESTLEELQMRQEMAQEIVGNGKTWNTFGLQAYKNSDSVMQKLRFLELTLTPKYA